MLRMAEEIMKIDKEQFGSPPVQTVPVGPSARARPPSSDEGMHMISFFFPLFFLHFVFSLCKDILEFLCGTPPMGTDLTPGGDQPGGNPGQPASASRRGGPTESGTNGRGKKSGCC